MAQRGRDSRIVENSGIGKIISVFTDNGLFDLMESENDSEQLFSTGQNTCCFVRKNMIQVWANPICVSAYLFANFMELGKNWRFT